MRRRTSVPRIRVVAVAGTVLLLIPMSSAAAAPGAVCTFDGTTGTATVTVVQGTPVTISRAGDAIAVDGFACQTATVHTTDLIDVAVVDVPESDTVVIDLSGGPLAPGLTDEGEGASEIEVAITGMDGSSDALHVVGSAGSDTLAAAGVAVNLNAGESAYDDDVAADGSGISLELDGAGGNDVLALQGFGSNLFGPTTVLGGDGDDVVTGDLDGDDALDAGAGRDVADYSWAQELHLTWQATGEALFSSGPSDDVWVGIEVARLTDGVDAVVYEGAATGETFLLGGADTLHVEGPIASGAPGDRKVHGGEGPDAIDFGELDLDPLTIELGPSTIQGEWIGRYDGFEVLFGRGGNDRIRVRSSGTYPLVVGRGGRDVLDLRRSNRGIRVTMGRPTFGPDPWIHVRELERIVGSNFDDVLIGPADAEASLDRELVGYFGRDLLVGSAGDDLLVGGAGSDTLRGNGGADVLKAYEGNDHLGGGSGPDSLTGGPGNDALYGGTGVDACDGGPGVDRLAGC